jgi:hypothetical protein
MKHMTEEELIAYREGVAAQRAVIAQHLAACQECRAELERIEAVLAALDTLPVPNPGDDYGRHVWQQIAPRLPERPARWWQDWVEPKRLGALAAVAALLVAAFLAGRFTKRNQPGNDAATTEQIRERVLVVAVGDHLSKSEMFLVELSNSQPNPSSEKLVNISAEQRRAEDLLEENRLYRQTALQEGDKVMASTLDELERFLLDVANSPDEITSAQLEKIRQKIEARGILFKVRVVGRELQERQKTTTPAPAQNGSKESERNKA